MEIIPKPINRRKFIGATLLAAAAIAGAEGKCLEPTWLKVRRVRLGAADWGLRLVHFSDLHHKGNREYLQTVVDQINALEPDFVCFTGDLVEARQFLPETLEILSGINVPLFGVPGNHDYWSRISFAPVMECFNATGGAWLVHDHRRLADGKINLIGAGGLYFNPGLPPSDPAALNILLMHYPAWTKKLRHRRFDLVLAGHSHGGQVRIPFYGSVIVPSSVEEYDLGLYDSPAGPLYVNPGIGYLGKFNFRFNCRPEITVFEV